MRGANLKYRMSDQISDHTKVERLKGILLINIFLSRIVVQCRNINFFELLQRCSVFFLEIGSRSHILKAMEERVSEP